MNEKSTADSETKLSVFDAYERLAAEQESLDKISVSAICAEASISRTTFYYHFKDKSDIMQWHFNHVAEKYLFETGRTLTFYQANYLNSIKVAKRGNVYGKAFRNRGYQALFQYSKRRRVETLVETARDWHHVKIDAELMFQIEGYADLEVGSLSRWFKQGMPYDANALASYLNSCVPEKLFAAVNEPTEPAFPHWAVETR